MVLSDMPPPTTSCLKRCRSEDPASLAELCSPPLKQPFLTSSSHHLSILQDLESSLNSMPTMEATPTPEELVTEMMQSLEKVMGDIGELIAGSSDSYTCATGDSPQAHEFSADDEPSPLIEAENTLSGPSEAPALCRDATVDCEKSELACDVCAETTLDGCRGMASNCEVDSAFGPCIRGDVDDEEPVMVATSEHVCTEGCARDGCIGCDNETSDGELGLTPGFEGTGIEGTGPTLATEQIDEHEHWDLVDELTDGFALSALPSNQINWFEEACDLPAFTLLPIEEEGVLSLARDSTELLLLDCYL